MVRKIVNLDNHVVLACAGLKADAHVLINQASIECQSHRLAVEDPDIVEYNKQYIAGLQQKFTQSGCVSAFGLSTELLDGVAHEGSRTVESQGGSKGVALNTQSVQRNCSR